MFNRIFRRTLLFLVAFSSLSIVYAQERSNPTCLMTETGGKLTINIKYPCDYALMMHWDAKKMSNFSENVKSNPRILVLKKLGIIRSEIEEARSSKGNPRKFRKYIKKIQNDVRSVCKRYSFHHPVEVVTPTEVLAADREILLTAIDSEAIQLINSESDDGHLFVGQSKLLLDIRRNAELLVLKS